METKQGYLVYIAKSVDSILAKAYAAGLNPKSVETDVGFIQRSIARLKEYLKP